MKPDKPSDYFFLVGGTAALILIGLQTFRHYSDQVKQQAYENRPIIAEECVMNGFGQGNCAFTNTGKTVGAVCGVIKVMGPGTAESSKFCSGQVQPMTTEKVDFTIPQVDELCDNGFESWTEKCDFTFVRDDAKESKDGGVQV